MSIKDLTGMKFGKLTVLDTQVPERIKQIAGKGGKAVWRCQCSCGNITYVESSNLQAGNTKSCGCLRREHAKIVGSTTKRGRSKKNVSQPFQPFPS